MHLIKKKKLLQQLQLSPSHTWSESGRKAVMNEIFSLLINSSIQWCVIC